MTQIISSQSLADISPSATTIEVSLDGTGHHAGLSRAAKETLRKLEALKTLLGEGAKDFRIVLEQHTPESAFVQHDDDCGNSWNIIGLHTFNSKLHHMESILRATGVVPDVADGISFTYSADQLKIMTSALQNGPAEHRVSTEQSRY